MSFHPSSGMRHGAEASRPREALVERSATSMRLRERRGPTPSLRASTRGSAMGAGTDGRHGRGDRGPSPVSHQGIHAGAPSSPRCWSPARRFPATGCLRWRTARAGSIRTSSRLHPQAAGSPSWRAAPPWRPCDTRYDESSGFAVGHCAGTSQLQRAHHQRTKDATPSRAGWRRRSPRTMAAPTA